MRVKSRWNRRGFTLIEIMVVVVILGILAAIIIPRISDRPEQARRTKATMDIRSIETALSLFQMDNGFYPSTEQGLEALVEQPTTGQIPTNYKEGGYLKTGTTERREERANMPTSTTGSSTDGPNTSAQVLPLPQPSMVSGRFRGSRFENA